MNAKTTRHLTALLTALLALPTLTQAMSARQPIETGEAATQAAAPNYDRPGFSTRLHKGSLWVFKAGSDELAAFDAGKVPAKHVVRPLAGPDNLTVRSSEGDVITLYLTAKPGFQTRLRKERLWIFPENAEALGAFDAGKVPAKHVVRPLAGPMGLTIIAEEAETLDAYLAE